MNTHQNLVEIPNQPVSSTPNLLNVPQVAELGILAAMAVFLVRYLVQSNQKLTEKLLDELDQN